MLEQMRSTAGKWVMWVLASLLIASFALWGIGDVFRGRTAPRDVAEVGGVKISAEQLRQEFRRAVDVLRNRLGPQFDSTQARQLGVLDQTLDTLIVDRLFVLEAATLGLDAGDDLVRSTVAADPAFHNAAGRFDGQIYRQALANQNMGEMGYEESLRANIVRLQLTRALTAGGVVPKKLHDLVYEFRNERRVAEVVRLARDGVAGVAEPSEPELVAFHNKYAAQFTAPEYRDVTVVHFDPTVMAAEFMPPEKRVREEYEYRLPSLSVPERRELQQILVQDRTLADRVHQSLQQGREFAKVATEIAKVSADSLSLGRLRRNDLPKQIADVAFALAEGGVSKPVNSALGWHILRVVKIEGGKAPTFAEVRKRISDDLAREQAVDALSAIANRFEDTLAGGASLEDAAAKADATSLRIPAIDVQGRDASGNPVKKVPGDPKFLETVFTTAVTATSPLTETQDGGFFMVRVNRLTPPALRPLRTVRARVIAAWKLVQQDEQAKKRAEALLARAKAAGSLAAAADEKGLKLETSKPFSRFIQDAESPLPQSLIRSMFKAKTGGVAMAGYNKGYAVARLKEIERARPEANAEEYKNIGTFLKTAIANDIVGQFTDALRQRYDVSIDQRAVEAMF